MILILEGRAKMQPFPFTKTFWPKATRGWIKETRYPGTVMSHKKTPQVELHEHINGDRFVVTPPWQTFSVKHSTILEACVKFLRKGVL